MRPAQEVIVATHEDVAHMMPKQFANLVKHRQFKYGMVASLLLGIGALGACQTQQQIVSAREDNLAAAGFIVRPANTPERQAMLKRLPPHQFVQRTNSGVVHFIYADP